MSVKQTSVSGAKVYTVKENLKRKRNISIMISVLFTVCIVGIILLFSLVYKHQTNVYFDDIAETRITNSGGQISNMVKGEINSCFHDTVSLRDHVEDEDISTSGALDYNKLYSKLDDFESYYKVDKVGVLVNNKLIFSETDQIEYTQSKVTKQFIKKIDDNLYFFIPNGNDNTLIDGIVSKISVSKMNSLIVPNVYGTSASVMVCDSNGNNIMVGDVTHGDKIDGNCIDDIKLYYSKESSDLFVELYTKGEKSVTHLANNPPLMLYLDILEFGDGDANFTLLFFVPRDLLTDQLTRLSDTTLVMFYVTLVIATAAIILLYLLLMNSIHKTQKSGSYDNRTGLLTEKSFFHDAQAIMFKHNSEFGIISMNIKGFTKLNQVYGATTADKILVLVGEVLGESLHEDDGDIAGYQNADSFLLLLKGDQDEITYKVSNLNNTLINHKYFENINLQFSFGIALASQEFATELRKIFDCAVFAERNKKDNDYLCFYNEEFTRKQRDAHYVTSRFEEALAKHEFEVYAQLKWDLNKNDWGGAEALVRWKDPLKGLISPGAFIPVFEDNGYITKLDMYVLEETCKYMSKMLDEGEKCVPISLNLSKRNFSDLSFIDKYLEIIDKYKVPHNLIQFEITEGLFIDNISSYKSFFYYFRNHGFTISMDDFGAGYSSLNLIHDLDFDVIKLDAKFFRGGLDEANKTIVSTIIKLCHDLGKSVVAEGVEESFEVEFLKGSSCDLIQGYYYSKPLPLDEARKLYLHLA